MARFVQRILNFLSNVCGSVSGRKSSTTSAESTGKTLNGHITTRCFLVLSFLIVIAFLIAMVYLYGNPLSLIAPGPTG